MAHLVAISLRIEYIITTIFSSRIVRCHSYQTGSTPQSQSTWIRLHFPCPTHYSKNVTIEFIKLVALSWGHCEYQSDRLNKRRRGGRVFEVFSGSLNYRHPHAHRTEERSTIRAGHLEKCFKNQDFIFNFKTSILCNCRNAWCTPWNDMKSSMLSWDCFLFHT